MQLRFFSFYLFGTWCLASHKDYGRTIVRFRKISKWYALASLCGGPLAIFGSYMAMGFIDPVFAAISSLFYPVIGAVIARLWYKEKISQRAAIGMCIIIFGGMVITSSLLLLYFASPRHKAYFFTPTLVIAAHEFPSKMI